LLLNKIPVFLTGIPNGEPIGVDGVEVSTDECADMPESTASGLDLS
jgi:hypothetical protein